MYWFCSEICQKHPCQLFSHLMDRWNQPWAGYSHFPALQACLRLFSSISLFPLDKFPFAFATAFSVLLVLRQLERLNQTKLITTADQKKGKFLSELRTTQGKINPTAKSAGKRGQSSQRGKPRATKSARENAGNQVRVGKRGQPSQRGKPSQDCF